MKLEMFTPSEAYDSGFAEGEVLSWNEAIEAAAGWCEEQDPELASKMSPEARANWLRKLKVDAALEGKK